MKLYTLPTGDPVHRYSKCVVVPFGGKRRVLSTAPLNGGFREDLTAVFNNDGNPGAGMACTLRAPTYEEHMALIAGEIGLDPQHTAAISTAASMENVAIVEKRYDDVAVTAVVTGGIEVNGGRVGDPSSWAEEPRVEPPLKQGTINIMVFFNVDLTPGALTRALVTCTEAKTAAIQELLAPSRYSRGLATGSGTDGCILVCNAEADATYTNTGKHSALGSILGQAVKQAVKEALNKQSGLNPRHQHNVFRRVDRFGITEDSLWQKYQGSLTRAEFAEETWQLANREELVTAVSLYAHLMDQVMWELLEPKEAWNLGCKLLGILEGKHGVPGEFPAEKDEMVDFMIGRLMDTLLSFIKN